ncbi:MAG: DUF2480 family protein [Bacteroidia bacterium]|nr:DUF2480 family protein [Bacteroidia bacterium]NNJ55013.1 DUF2480 family protein [Bacteroidia bacterium]
MVESNEIVNKVANSGIITLDLEELIQEKPVFQLDIKDQLFQGLLLREKDFRAWVKEHNWEQYKDAYVAVYCSSDAIVPTWAYMLIGTAIEPYTSDLFFTPPATLPALIAERKLSNLNADDFVDARVVIKGCGDREIDNQAYVKLTMLLLPVVKSLMYGEPCSTVPVYKKR